MTLKEQLLLIEHKPLLSLKEASLFTGISVNMLYELTAGKSKTPVIGYYQPNGKDKYFDKKDLIAYMTRYRIKGQDEIEALADKKKVA